MTCPKCGTKMNHHADKVDYLAEASADQRVDRELGGVLKEIYTCPKCGDVETQPAES